MTAPRDASLPELKDIDFMDVEIQECPFGAYKRLRDDAPVFRDPKSGFFVATRYADLREILKNTADFSAERRKEDEEVDAARAERIRKRFEEKGWVPAPTLLLRDDPGHAQLRALFEHAFRPSILKQIDPFVEEVTNRLMNDFIDDGRCDVVKQYAVPLPLIVIGRQMGVPESDIWKIKTWTNAWVARTGLMLQDEDAVMAAVDLEIEAQHYFQPIFEKLRREPDGSLLSELVNREIPEWGRPLNDNELHGEMMADTFVGGSETTANALSAGIMLIGRDKNIWTRLKADPEARLRTFVEEVLRLESPVQGRVRIARQDMELHGVKIPAGSIINLRYAAANRDERQFPNPDALDLGRRNAGSHMAFSSGIHHCLGAPLARRELYWGFKGFLDKIDDFRLIEELNDYRHIPNFWLRALDKLHIEFTKAPAPAGGAP